MFVIVLSLRRVIEMKRMSVNYSIAESFAYIQIYIFALVRDLLLLLLKDWTDSSQHKRNDDIYMCSFLNNRFEDGINWYSD